MIHLLKANEVLKAVVYRTKPYTYLRNSCRQFFINCFNKVNTTVLKINSFVTNRSINAGEHKLKFNQQRQKPYILTELILKLTEQCKAVKVLNLNLHGPVKLNPTLLKDQLIINLYKFRSQGPNDSYTFGVHTHIISHYKPPVKSTTQFSTALMLCVLILYMSGARPTV